MVGIITEIYGDIVKFDTDIGSFYGKWCANSAPEFKRYVLELDNDELLCYEMITRSTTNTYFIKNVGKTIKINGYVEEVQDNVMIFRLKESILMLEISSQNNFSPFVNSFLCITLNGINLYDVDI